MKCNEQECESKNVYDMICYGSLIYAVSYI